MPIASTHHHRTCTLSPPIATSLTSPAGAPSRTTVPHHSNTAHPPTPSSLAPSTTCPQFSRHAHHKPQNLFHPSFAPPPPQPLPHHHHRCRRTPASATAAPQHEVSLAHFLFPHNNNNNLPTVPALLSLASARRLAFFPDDPNHNA
ncbi:uncharacterized protein K452DRAFT_311880 [Aplosporella prunicola CBS 121167]|uniref:Uncharacterized protein n=1 Tax=Aplosporella prunicola CBS 121167 TaxID=1176127 RepID=A0A6A6B2R1_9PEZI|nr:uncharacterized protein K452DRAFT_311880 [Aplosporella prunicola CBS 121167]KAF2138106.1 hypothetical protein K452DRAFT_311880 [Aplosporella prunicola CBS 121167]